MELEEKMSRRRWNKERKRRKRLSKAEEKEEEL
jgi:hypothetical protein